MSELQAVMFRLGEERFAVEARQVVSVEPYQGVQRVPGTLPFLLGVTTVRGEVIPVFDLAVRFGYADGQGGQEEGASKLIVVRTGKHTVAFAVDDVLDVLNLEGDALVPPPDLVGGVEARYLAGMVPGRDETIVLMNLEQVLSDAEMEQLQAVRERVRG
ncbi:MAG: chemotaxis protein CheW [Alicyclobacillus herbarius]|uniref:chemotaxis protein CheW n=1 Tax=Alicyclobacillus herbarius TaxID=122960 RepID=UPI00040C0AA8|nr:chemotaxis protein CheW [Alicyclobacillus herbarius]MCL6631997.1 chemotaxis protein CheW [Alicyclobacillus herbarius]